MPRLSLASQRIAEKLSTNPNGLIAQSIKEPTPHVTEQLAQNGN